MKYLFKETEKNLAEKEARRRGSKKVVRTEKRVIMTLSRIFYFKIFIYLFKKKFPSFSLSFNFPSLINYFPSFKNDFYLTIQLYWSIVSTEKFYFKIFNWAISTVLFDWFLYIFKNDKWGPKNKNRETMIRT